MATPGFTDLLERVQLFEHRYAMAWVHGQLPRERDRLAVLLDEIEQQAAELAERWQTRFEAGDAEEVLREMEQAQAVLAEAQSRPLHLN